MEADKLSINNWIIKYVLKKLHSEYLQYRDYSPMVLFFLFESSLLLTLFIYYFYTYINWLSSFSNFLSLISISDTVVLDFINLMFQSLKHEGKAESQVAPFKSCIILNYQVLDPTDKYSMSFKSHFKLFVNFKNNFGIVELHLHLRSLFIKSALLNVHDTAPKRFFSKNILLFFSRKFLKRTFLKWVSNKEISKRTLWCHK